MRCAKCSGMESNLPDRGEPSHQCTLRVVCRADRPLNERFLRQLVLPGRLAIRMQEYCIILDETTRCERDTEELTMDVDIDESGDDRQFSTVQHPNIISYTPSYGLAFDLSERRDVLYPSGGYIDFDQPLWLDGAAYRVEQLPGVNM